MWAVSRYYRAICGRGGAPGDLGNPQFAAGGVSLGRRLRHASARQRRGAAAAGMLRRQPKQRLPKPRLTLRRRLSASAKPAEAKAKSARARTPVRVTIPRTNAVTVRKQGTSPMTAPRRRQTSSPAKSSRTVSALSLTRWMATLVLLPLAMSAPAMSPEQPRTPPADQSGRGASERNARNVSRTEGGQ